MGKWEMVRLGEVFYQIKNGASIKQGVVDGGIPITRIETISDGTINREKLGYAGVSDDKYSNFYLEDGDILMSHINSEKHLGKVALYIKKGEEQIIHGMNLLCLKSNGVSQEYMYYFFKSNVFKNQIPPITKKSVNQASFTVTALKNISVPLPPLDDQKRIAKNLDLASEIGKGYKEQLAELDKLVQSVFYEMFGDPVTNEKGWRKGILRDVVTEVKYGTSKPAVAGGRYKYLRMGNITYKGGLDLSDLKYIDISDNDLEKYIVRKGDILFNRTNSKELVGKTCVFSADEPMIIAGYIIRVRTNELVLPTYLSMVLNSAYGKKTLANMCKSIIGQANINAQELQLISLLIPPLPLQTHFASIVTEIESQKTQVQQALTEAENLFNSLMQEYFE